MVGCLRVIAPELPFPIVFREIDGAEQEFELNGYRIRAFKVNHNVLCYGYTIEIDRAGKFDVERAKAQEIPQKYWSRLQNGETIEEEKKIFTPKGVNVLLSSKHAKTAGCRMGYKAARRLNSCMILYGLPPHVFCIALKQRL